MLLLDNVLLVGLDVRLFVASRLLFLMSMVLSLCWMKLVMVMLVVYGVLGFPMGLVRLVVDRRSRRLVCCMTGFVNYPFVIMLVPRRRLDPCQQGTA